MTAEDLRNMKKLLLDLRFAQAAVICVGIEILIVLRGE